MKSWAVTEPGKPLEEIDIPDPVAPIGKGVVLDVTHCGVCHSDVHFWEGFLDIGGVKVPIAELGIQTPFTLGHEIVGTVVAVGPEVTDVAIGDRRLVFPWIGCGTCGHCIDGRDNLCSAMRSIGVRNIPGGFAQKVSVPDEKYLVDFGDIDPAVAATYACSGLTVFSAIKKVMPMPRSSPVVVIGAGGLGLNAISILRALGHENIVSLDVSAGNREAALAQGARAVADNADPETLAALPDIAQGPVATIIDLVNSAQTAEFAFRALAKGGRLIQVGLFGGALSLPLAAMPTRALTIAGSFVGDLSELRELVNLAQGGRIPPIPVTCTHKHNAGQALQALREGKVRERIVLDASHTVP